MRKFTSEAMRALYCGESLSNSRSKFQSTASASKSEPSWNFTPLRSLKVHLVLSASFTSQLSASPGMRPDALSAELMSQLMSPS